MFGYLKVFQTILPYMVETLYCVKCGEEVREKVLFCPNCGVRTKKGIEENVSIPKERQQNWEQELEQTLSRAGREIEKTLSIATEEIEKAFKTTRERIGEKNEKKNICPKCKKENSSSSEFCYDCGNKLT